MPRYLVERSFPDGLSIPMNDEGRQAVAGVVSNNAESGVTWIHSYVTPDRRRSYCICDSASPEAIRVAGRNNDLPVDRITEVQVLDLQGPK